MTYPRVSSSWPKLIASLFPPRVWIRDVALSLAYPLPALSVAGASLASPLLNNNTAARQQFGAVLKYLAP
jgi:hypothetical protein